MVDDAAADARRNGPRALFLHCLRCALGPSVSHAAFIMDGNRRYAKARSLPVEAGHAAGYASLLNVLQWSYEFGISEVTVYAFSIDNFGRPSAEVDALMDLAVEKFKEFQTKESLVMQRGVVVKVCGDIDSLRGDVADAARAVTLATCKNRGPRLNVCFAYSGRNEIDNVVTRREELWIENPVDVVVRTSGETRLSDFLLWQCSVCSLVFLSKTWPELGVLDFAYAMFRATLDLIQRDEYEDKKIR